MSNKSLWKTVLFKISGDIQNIRGTNFLEVLFYPKPIPYSRSKKRKTMSQEDYIDFALRENYCEHTFCGRAWVPLFDSEERDIAYQRAIDNAFAKSVKIEGVKTSYIGLCDFLSILEVNPKQYFQLLSKAEGDHLKCMNAVCTARLPKGHNCFFGQIVVKGRKGSMKRFTSIKIINSAPGVNWESWMTENIDERLEQISPSKLGKGDLSLDGGFGDDLLDLIDENL